jgi:hypothetical protein
MKWLNRACNSLATVAFAGHAAVAIAAPKEGRHFVFFYATSGKPFTQISFPDVRYCKLFTAEVDKSAAETGVELSSMDLVTSCSEKSYADALGAKAVIHDLVGNFLFELSAETMEDCEWAAGTSLSREDSKEMIIVSPCSLK